MWRALVSLILLISTGAFAADANLAKPAFKKLMQLQGEWAGNDADGKPVHSSFKPVVSDTTLMETLSPSGMEEMLSLYTVDGDGIQVSHFCPTNNQPRMRAVPTSADPQELDFHFTGAGNLADVSVGHQHRLVIHFEDANHITETWTWHHGDHDMPMVFTLTRQPKH